MKQFSFLVFMMVIVSTYGADKVGIVQGSRLNVRTKPMASSEVVCQLLKGEKAVIQKLEGNWVAIDVPEKCQGWIPTSTIQNTTLSAATKAYVGPATVFTMIGSLNKGDTVTAIRTKGSWTLVRAPFRGQLWVHADYITLPAGMKRPVVADSDGGKVPSKTGTGSGEVVKVNPKNPEGDVPSKPIKAPKDMVVHEMTNEVLTSEITPISTAKRVTKTGVVVRLEEKQGRAFSHALAAQINNRFYPLFYLRKGNADLEKWELHRVTISGDRQWVKGYPRPVVDVRSIAPESK